MYTWPSEFGVRIVMGVGIELMGLKILVNGTFQVVLLFS